MNPGTRTARLRARWVVPTLTAAALLAGTVGSGPAVARGTERHATVVLVHGAWADSSSWSGVVRRLQDDGYRVEVFPTPLRSLAGDSLALRTYLLSIPGPVVLVAHSYGGAVATDAATGLRGVRALVYLDAFAPDVGEDVLHLVGAGSALAGPDPTKVFRLVPAGPPTATTDLYVLPDVFPHAFANDLGGRQAAVLAATQRPVTLGALSEPSTAPAWRTVPSWYEVGTLDRVVPPSQQRRMAQRAGARVVEVASSHLPMVSHPAAVERLIEAADAATSRP